MALFTSSRDSSLMRHLNREMINNIIQTEIDIYKIDTSSSSKNIYGESNKKEWFEPVRLACLIRHEERSGEYDEFGYNKKQGIRFGILKDDLIKHNILIEVGDVFHWDNTYYEISDVIDNQYWGGKRPQTNKTIGVEFGWDVSIIAVGHMTNRTNIQIENTQTGYNKHDDYL